MASTFMMSTCTPASAYFARKALALSIGAVLRHAFKLFSLSLRIRRRFTFRSARPRIGDQSRGSTHEPFDRLRAQFQ